jgi:hypothetical protein
MHIVLWARPVLEYQPRCCATQDSPFGVIEWPEHSQRNHLEAPACSGDVLRDSEAGRPGNLRGATVASKPFLEALSGNSFSLRQRFWSLKEFYCGA